MLKASRSWPIILHKTMAVVQLRFDGKYAYSTIANINQSHIIENQTTVRSESIADFHNDDDDNKQEAEHRKDLNGKCRSLVVSSNSTISSNGNNSRQQHNNGQHHLCHSHSHMNGHSLNNSATSSPTIKVCICNYHSKKNNNRERSESIKVDNWDYIYRERGTYLDVSHEHNANAVPKSPQNGFNCDHGYLSGRGAEKLDTIFRHYYPEGGYAWIILVVSILVAIFTHGLQLSAIFFLLPAVEHFHADTIECLGELKN